MHKTFVVWRCDPILNFAMYLFSYVLFIEPSEILKLRPSYLTQGKLCVCCVVLELLLKFSRFIMHALPLSQISIFCCQNFLKWNIPNIKQVNQALQV